MVKEEDELLKHNPYVTVAFCNERSTQNYNRTMDKLNSMEKKIDKLYKKTNSVTISKLQEYKEWRVFLFGILGAIFSGVIIAVFLKMFP